LRVGGVAERRDVGAAAARDLGEHAVVDRRLEVVAFTPAFTPKEEEFEKELVSNLGGARSVFTPAQFTQQKG